VSDEVDRAFQLEGFRDYMALEAGNSVHTVENYLRDLHRFVQFSETRKAREPKAVTRNLLRDFVFLLKDLGLSPATIRRQVSALHTYFGFLIGVEFGEGFVSKRPPKVEDPIAAFEGFEPGF